MLDLNGDNAFVVLLINLLKSCFISWAWQYLWSSFPINKYKCELIDFKCSGVAIKVMQRLSVVIYGFLSRGMVLMLLWGVFSRITERLRVKCIAATGAQQQ